MNKIRVVVTLVAIAIYCGIAWFYGIEPALGAILIWILGQIDGREEYNDWCKITDEQE